MAARNRPCALGFAMVLNGIKRRRRFRPETRVSGAVKASLFWLLNGFGSLRFALAQSPSPRFDAFDRAVEKRKSDFDAIAHHQCGQCQADIEAFRFFDVGGDKNTADRPQQTAQTQTHGRKSYC